MQAAATDYKTVSHGNKHQRPAQKQGYIRDTYQKGVNTVKVFIRFHKSLSQTHYNIPLYFFLFGDQMRMSDNQIIYA